jgi:hypothetical protein
MTDHLICNSLYEFLVYPNPLDHSIIYKGRRGKHLSQAERLSYRSELSHQELDALVDKFRGIPLLTDHQGNDANDMSTFHGNPREAAGVVVDVYWASEGLVNVVQLYHSITGLAAATAIASGNMRCVSLQHVSIGDCIQIREISLCLRGKRSGARLLRIRPTAFTSLPSPGPYIERPLDDGLVDLSYLGQVGNLATIAASDQRLDQNDSLRMWSASDEKLWQQCCDEKWPIPRLEQWQNDVADTDSDRRMLLIHRASAWLRCYYLTIAPIVRPRRYIPFF